MEVCIDVKSDEKHDSDSDLATGLALFTSQLRAQAYPQA